MGNTTMTEPTTILGYAIGDHKADDGDHVGLGRTPEDAQAALEHARDVNAEKSYHTDLLGWIDTPKER